MPSSRTSNRPSERHSRNRDENSHHRDNTSRHRDEGGRHRDEGGRHRDEGKRHRDEGGRHREESSRYRDDYNRYRDDERRHRDDGSRHRDDGIRYRDDERRHRDYGNRHRDDGSRHRDDGSRHRDDGSRHRRDGSRHRDDESRHRDSSSHHRDDGSRHRDDGSHHRDDGSRHRDDHGQHRDNSRHREDGARRRDTDRYRDLGNRYHEDDDQHRVDRSHRRSDAERQRHDTRYKDEERQPRETADRLDADNARVALYRSQPADNHNTSIIPVPSGDIIEKLNEDEWVTRRRVEVTTTKNIETRVQRQLLLEDGEVVEDSGPIISTDTTVDTTEKKDENTEHRKGAGNDDGVPEGYVPVPGGAVVSERFTNITNTHEQKDDVREEEEIHHLGDYTNEEVSRAIRDGADARALVRARASSSDHHGQLVDPRNGQRRVVHQSGKTWRTVDTEDIHEKSHQDDKGELITETARTKQREEFSNVLVPDDGEQLPESGVREAARSSSHHRRHTKDVDMLEYYSVPRGGRVGDGIKLGDGLRYVQENVEEDREGDDNIESLSERMRQLRQLGYKPEGQVLAKTPIEYQEEEKTKRQVTNKWLESHFAKGDSDSENGEPQRTRLGIEGRRQGVDEVDHHRETNTYQYQKSSGTTQTGSAAPKTWSKSEKYTKNVRETPEHTYVTESRQGPRGGFDRVQVLPALGSSSKATDLQSEVDEDPIFNSKFSTGKPRRSGGVRFQADTERTRWEDSGRLSPPTQSPPPPPPPRHRKKGRDTQSPPEGTNNNHYASSPIRERYQRDLTPSQSREYNRQIEDSYQSSPSRQRRHDHDNDRRDDQSRREFHFGSRDSHQVSRAGRESSSDEQRRRLAGGGDEERLVSRHHRSVDQLDDRSQTLPRRPQQYPPSPVQRPPDTSRFGGSLINVSSKQPRGGGPLAPQKLARSPIQRSNSMYNRDGNAANEAFSVGLKSPNIISKMQRGTLRRGDGDGDRYRAEERESQTSSSTPSYSRSPPGRPRPPPGSVPPSSGDVKKDSFMHGLKKAAPDLYNVLHGDGGKTPSPKQSPPMTPPPPLQRAQSPSHRPSSGQRPGIRRVERLRGDDDGDSHSRSRSYTPPEDASYRSSPRPNVVKVQR